MKHSWLERLNLLKINDISLAVIAAVKLLHTMTEFDAYHIAFLGGKLIHRIAKESAYKLVGMHGTQNTLNHNLARFPGLPVCWLMPFFTARSLITLNFSIFCSFLL